MANPQLYTLAYITVESKLLTEEASVTLTRASNSQAVNTVANGYSGESPGAATVQIQVTNAVPAAGFELNAGAFIRTLKLVEIGLIAAGQQLKVVGFIIEDTFKHSVNSASDYDFTFRGSFADFE